VRCPKSKTTFRQAHKTHIRTNPMCLCHSSKFQEVSDPTDHFGKVKDLMESFNSTDFNHDRRHCVDEIVRVMMEQEGYTKHDKTGKYIDATVATIFARMDSDHNGRVSLKEFLDVFPDKNEADFNLGDTDGDGVHTVEEQLAHQSSKLTSALLKFKNEAQAYIFKADQDGDGCISIQEFSNLM